jgi:hypothetical protein
MEEGLAWFGWWRPCVAGVTPVSSLCCSCRDPVTFNKALVKGFIIFAGSGVRWRRSQPAAGVAGSLVEAGLLGWMSWQSLGHQPAGCSALGLPSYSSPRHGVIYTFTFSKNHLGFSNGVVEGYSNFLKKIYIFIRDFYFRALGSLVVLSFP